MKHYAVILDWSHDYEGDVEIIAVAHTPEAARKAFAEQVEKERAFAKENSWEINEDEDDSFRAGEEYSNTTEHTYLWIGEFDSLKASDRPEERLKLCSIKDLAKYYAGLILKDGKFNENIPGCDFAIADSLAPEDASLEDIRDSSSGWYGMKKFDAGFDSTDLCLIADYYGGGCAVITQLFDGMDDDDIADEIERIILGTFNVCESAHSDTELIVEFDLEKGDENDAENV